MFDFSLTDLNTDNPAALPVIYALSTSFILACGIAFTYQKTSQHNTAPGHFIQSMILGAIIAAVVTIAIGDNIGRGLGMLGIMSIIRFRTNMLHPRNMIFMFAALAIGISCGVFSFNIAVYGCMFFCFVAFLLHVSPFKTFSKKQQTLRVQFAEDRPEGPALVFQIVNAHQARCTLARVDYRISDKVLEKEFVYELDAVEDKTCEKIIQEIANQIPTIAVRYSMRHEDQPI